MGGLKMVALFPERPAVPVQIGSHAVVWLQMGKPLHAALDAAASAPQHAMALSSV
jgi:hypothetical protein